MEKCAAVTPGDAPSVIKTKPLPTQKPAVKAQKPTAEVKPAAPSKTQESWQPWHSMASVLMVTFLVALVAMSGSTFGLVDATSLAKVTVTAHAAAPSHMQLYHCHALLPFLHAELPHFRTSTLHP